MRTNTLADQLIYRFDKCLNALPKPSLSIKNIAQLFEKGQPIAEEQITSRALMCINHSGEVSAQALYLGQAFMARDKKLAEQLYKAAGEEQAHLKWCKERLIELNAKPSLLTPVWAFGSFGIGMLAGFAGDKISLGFLAETENQVSDHLEKHLNIISPHDTKSIAILQQMQKDEKKHATHAIELGGVALPKPICKLMALCSKVMTTVAKYI